MTTNRHHCARMGGAESRLTGYEDGPTRMGLRLGRSCATCEFDFCAVQNEEPRVELRRSPPRYIRQGDGAVLAEGFQLVRRPTPRSDGRPTPRTDGRYDDTPRHLTAAYYASQVSSGTCMLECCLR